MNRSLLVDHPVCRCYVKVMRFGLHVYEEQSICCCLKIVSNLCSNQIGYQDRTEVVENQRRIELVSDILHHQQIVISQNEQFVLGDR